MSRNECNLAQVTRFENSRSSNEGASCTIYLIEQLANETSDLASDMENFSRSTPLVYTLWLLDEGVHPRFMQGSEYIAVPAVSLYRCDLDLSRST